MGSPAITPKYSDLPPGAQMVHDPQAAAASYSDLPPGATVVHDPSSTGGAAQSQPGPLSRAASAFDEWTAGTDNPSEALQGLKMAVQHPSLEGQSLLEMGKGVVRGMQDTWNRAGQEWNSPGVMNKVNAGIHAVESGIPVVGPALSQIDQELGQGKYPEAAGHALAVAGPALAGSPEARANVGDAVSTAADKVNPRGMFAQKMNASSPTEAFTPQDRFQTAKDHGINLDLADATEAGPAQMAKKVVSRSLGGTKTFANTQEANLGALNEWGGQYLDKLSPNSGEAAGSRVQAALEADLDSKKAEAQTAFSDLDKRVGANSVAIKPIQDAAQQIVGDNQRYYEAHPELQPKHAWAVVQDLAKDDSARSSWSDLHQLRSDLMDVYRNNPDIVKSRANSWLQQMVGTIDNTMTEASSGLSPKDLAQFRDANGVWEDMKGTYDNPQHPFYHALRTPQASMAPGMMGMKAPELARQINDTLGPNAGDFQRAVVEKILGRDASGAGYDYKGMPSRLRQYPPEYLNELLGPESSAELYKMARIGKTLYDNPNPSGTSAVGIPAAEAGAIGASALHGNFLPMAAPPTEYGIARFMNSPKVVNYLTQPGKKLGAGSIAESFQRNRR